MVSWLVFGFGVGPLGYSARTEGSARAQARRETEQPPTRQKVGGDDGESAARVILILRQLGLG